MGADVKDEWGIWKMRGVVDGSAGYAARQRVVAWRLANLEAWERGLEELHHFDPEYVYDIGHEYDLDWTSDPDYYGVHVCPIDKAGVMAWTEPWSRYLSLSMADTCEDALGNRVVEFAEIYLPKWFGVDLGLLSNPRGLPSSQIVPDLMLLPELIVLLPALELPPGASRSPQDQMIRPLDGDPVPALVAEMAAPHTREWDLNGKRRLYAALGIAEYLMCDFGDVNLSDTGGTLLLYRLQDGKYCAAAAHPALSEPEAPAFRSEVLGTHIRMRRGHRRPRFQWYDAARGRWRDRETDDSVRLRQEAGAEGRIKGFAEGYAKVYAERHVGGYAAGYAEGHAKAAIEVMHDLLHSELALGVRERIAAVWRQDGPPADVVTKIMAVKQEPKEWSSLLGFLDDDDMPGLD